MAKRQKPGQSGLINQVTHMLDRGGRRGARGGGGIPGKAAGFVAGFLSGDDTRKGRGGRRGRRRR
jgi:hypothetical protein